MFSGSITVLIMLVAFSSPGQTSNTTSSVSQSSQTITPSSASAAHPIASNSAITNPNEPKTTPPIAPTTKPDQTGNSTTTTPAEKSRTCAKLSLIVKMDWDEMLTNKLSKFYEIFTTGLLMSLRSLYNKSEYLNVTEVTFTEEAKEVLVNATLCLVVKENEDIENMFINKVKSGMLDVVPVKNDSAEFETIGVSFMEWKAKDGECEKKCEGAGGPIDIERKCQAERYSCNGHKNKSDTSDECVKYCPSSNAAIAVPSLILTIGILLSFSFQ